MADGLGYNPAVALQTDSGNGLNTLSKIMALGSSGLSQEEQRQAIASNKQKLAQGQIETEAQQGSNNFFQNWSPGDHHDDTGMIDIDSAHQTPEYQSLTGAAKIAVDTQLNAFQKQQLDNKRTLVGLNKDVVGQFGQVAQAISQKPEMGPQLLEAFGKQGSDNQRIVDLYGPKLAAAKFDPSAAKVVAAQSQDVAGQLAQSNPGTQNVDAGGKIIQQVVPKASGIPQNVGSLVKSTPPTVTTNAAGQTIRVAPGATSASVIPTAAPPGAAPGVPVPNANPTEAQAAGQAIQAKAVGDRVSQVQTQAANTVQAQDALSRAKAILESPESPNTGAGFENKKFLINSLSSLGIDTGSADDMNTLTKNLARFEATRATAAGLGGTDAARELAHNGSPNTQLDNKALQGIVRQSLATEKVLAGYANVQSRTNDPQQQLKNEAAFRALPHPIETTEYMMSRNKTEAEAYLKSHNLSHDDIAKSAAAIKQFSTP